MATVKTYYKVEATNYHHTNFSMQLFELDDINTDCTEKELVRQVRDVWHRRSVSELEGLSITPMTGFEILDGEDSKEKYTLDISRKQLRSKKEDLRLHVGSNYMSGQVFEWQEPLVETA